MFIDRIRIFVLYIIRQNNPVSKSLRCMIPWYLRNRNYRRRVLRYRRRVPSYRRHRIKLPSSGIPDNFAYRRLAANLSEIIIRKWSFDARCTMPLSFVVANLREIDGRKKGGRMQKLLQASGRVGAILTTVVSRGCPHAIMWHHCLSEV